MRKWIFLTLIVLTGIVKGQAVNLDDSKLQILFEKEGNVILSNDTIRIGASDYIYRVALYVDDSSTDSCEYAGDIFILQDGTVTDTIVIAPGLNKSFICPYGFINKATIISRDGCKVLVTLFKK